MKNDILILGSGGFAKEVAFLIEEINKKINKWNIIGYVDKIELIGNKNGKYKVITNEDELINKNDEINIAIGIGNPIILNEIIKKLKNNNKIKYPNLVHPNVIADLQNIEIGIGNIITANNIFTTDIKIGTFNIFNLACTVGHDTQIGDFNVFNPNVNISGGVDIGNRVVLGTGSQILQYLNVCDAVTVGAGSVVTKDISESGVYVGIPARKIK